MASAEHAEPRDDESLAAERVVQHIERLIQGGELKPGDRLPAERELARHVKVSRPSVRAGLRSLAALGIVMIVISTGLVLLATAAGARFRIGRTAE